MRKELGRGVILTSERSIRGGEVRLLHGVGAPGKQVSGLLPSWFDRGERMLMQVTQR